jgi:hypothetical protein
VLLTAAMTLAATTLADRSDPVALPENTAIRVTLDQVQRSEQSGRSFRSYGLRTGRHRRQDGDPSGRPR